MPRVVYSNMTENYTSFQYLDFSTIYAHHESHFQTFLVAIVALIAGTLGGVVGFGSGVLLLPILSLILGPRETVPLLTLSTLIGNASRAYLSRHDIDWEVVQNYCFGAVPCAITGELLYLRLDPKATSLIFGVFILAMIPLRRYAAKHELKITLQQFKLLGAVMGFLLAFDGFRANHCRAPPKTFICSMWTVPI